MLCLNYQIATAQHLVNRREERFKINIPGNKRKKTLQHIYTLVFPGSKVMQGERKWHMLLTIFCLLITSGQCTDSKDVTQKERRTLLDLILQVIRDSQQREKNVSRRCITGLLTSAQDMKFSSPEKPFYIPRLDNSRLIGKLIRFIFRS